MLPYALALAACVPKYGKLEALPPGGLWTPLPVQHVEVALPAVGPVDLAYVDSGGDGPPMIFIHGLSSTIGFWEYQLPHFAQSHRVLALDLPGYGASARPDAPCTPPWYAEVVVAWLDALSIDSAIVSGHSMGGQIALTLALDHPERVDALVLSAPAGFERFTDGAARWMKSWWHEERALEAREADMRATFQTMAFNRTDEGVERLLEERVRLGKHPAFRGTSVAVSRSIAGMVDHPVLDRLHEIDKPTMILFGTDDHMIPNPVFTGGRTAAVARQGQRAIAGSRLVLIPGAGHTVHHDAPDAFNAAVDGFLAELQPAAALSEAL